MCVNHQDKGWWKAFCQETKRAFKKNDLQMKAHLYELYERHMNQRALLGQAVLFPENCENAAKMTLWLC